MWSLMQGLMQGLMQALVNKKSMFNLLLSSVLTGSLMLSATPCLALDFNKLKDVIKAQTQDGAQDSSQTSNAVKPTEPTSAIALEPNPSTINWKNPSNSEEIALGHEITGNILGAAPLVKDMALQNYVNQVGRWVAIQSERADLAWHFGVIESDDLNAFAAPGGYVLITKGLYKKLTNEAQLAGVLGHEIAHVVKKHQLKLLQKQQLLNLGAKFLGNKLGKNNDSIQKAIGSGAEISARSLDKDAEYEADSMGMVLATRAGYEPFGLSDVLQVLAQTNPADSSVALLFKTHPRPDERLIKLGDAVGSAMDNVTGKTLEARFYKLQ